jgi:hypothetical protein
MFIRHGEKPPDAGGPPFGITEDGIQDDHSLIVQGWVRSGALVGYFSSSHGNIVAPDYMYGAAYAHGKNSPHGKRPYETVSALAAARGMSVDARFSVGEEAALAADIATRSEQTVLVSWEHHAISTIVQAVTNDPGFSQTWPERFDLVWVLNWNGNRYDFALENQHLLHGDQ